MESMILLVLMSNLMESFTLTIGSGYRMVRPSEVYKKGTFLGPVLTALTRHNLYLASCKFSSYFQMRNDIKKYF